jgi:2-(1,2-epoxy-1,2-dihydrophenyl)acetyl-CoA isomerase
MTDYHSTAGLVVEEVDSVLRVTIDRPEARNSIDAAMMDTLIDTLETAGQDEAIRVIVLGGSSQNFCAGADLVARNRPTEERPRVGSIQRRVPTQAHRLIPTILTTQVPIVAVVDGWAAGIGFHIAIASDFCVATTSARFWEPFMSRGFTPDSGGTWLLPRLVGMARARALLLLGRELSGVEAVEWGLIHQAVERDDLTDAAEQLIEHLAKGPTVALGLTKWLLHTGSEQDLEHQLRSEAFALELTSRSEDFREGLAAFGERRDADFRGR